jgi:hypothetical protein
MHELNSSTVIHWIVPHEPIARYNADNCSKYVKEALIKSELPRHMDVPPCSMADKPLSMQNEVKSHFTLFWV